MLPVDPRRVASTPSEGVLPHVSARAPPPARPVPTTVHSAPLAAVPGPAGQALPLGAGKLVSLKHLRAGDLLFYARDTADRRTIYHVGMYLGAGRMVEAPNRRAPVRIASIWRPGLLGKATRPASGVRGMLSVEPGERSKAVAAVQQRLAANLRCVTVDGEFGPRTRRALIAFQRDHGLPADGVVGRGTWGKLIANGRQRSPNRC